MARRRSFSSWCIPPICLLQSVCVCVCVCVCVYAHAFTSEHVFSAAPSGWQHRAPSCGQLHSRGLPAKHLLLSGSLPPAAPQWRTCGGRFFQYASLGIYLHHGVLLEGQLLWTTFPVSLAQDLSDMWKPFSEGLIDPVLKTLDSPGSRQHLFAPYNEYRKWKRFRQQDVL